MEDICDATEEWRPEHDDEGRYWLKDELTMDSPKVPLSRLSPSHFRCHSCPFLPQAPFPLSVILPPFPSAVTAG